MIYQYSCPSCTRVFDVVKSVHDMNLPETCSQCGTESVRDFVPSRVHFIGTKVEHPEFNPGLGAVVRNKEHRKELAKQKGVEEIGNEPLEKLHKHFEERRLDKLERAYDDATKGWVGNGDTGT